MINTTEKNNIGYSVAESWMYEYTGHAYSPWPEHKNTFPPPPNVARIQTPYRTLQLVYDPECHTVAPPAGRTECSIKQSTENEHQNNPQKTQAKEKPSIKNAFPQTPDEVATGGDRDMVEGGRQAREEYSA